MDALELLDVLETVNVKQIAVTSLEQKEEVMADYNATQLAQGLRATGTPIRPEYHPLTKEIKKEKTGLAGVTDRVTLFDTGAHYKALYAEVKGDEIEFGSKNWKEEKLQKKYGAIYGLTEDSHDEFVNQHLEPQFLNNMHDATGL